MCDNSNSPSVLSIEDDNLYEKGSILNETKEQLIAEYTDELSLISIERIVVGIFYTGVQLNNGSGGICFTPIKEIPESVCCPSSARAMPRAGRLKEMTMDDVFSYLTQPSPLKRAIAIATMNALSDGIWRKKEKEGIINGYSIIEGDNILDYISKKEIQKVVIIGALIPVIKDMKAKGIPYRIAELDIRALKEEEIPYFVSQEDLSKELATSDLVIISGTTLINDTLESILKECRKEADIILIGPTATMLPDAFFKRNVRMLAGNRVCIPEKILDVLSEGGSGYHFFGKSSEKVMIIGNDNIP